MRIRLKSLKPGWGPIGGEIEIRPGDREILNPLFEELRDRRALLQPAEGRAAQSEYVTASIREIRRALTDTSKALDPGSEARSWVEQLRTACREYLTAVESLNDGIEEADFRPALAQLRSSFRIVARHVGAYYRVPAARDLADDMTAHPDQNSEDAAAKPGNQGRLGQTSADANELRVFVDTNVLSLDLDQLVAATVDGVVERRHIPRLGDRLVDAGICTIPQLEQGLRADGEAVVRFAARFLATRGSETTFRRGTASAYLGLLLVARTGNRDRIVQHLTVAAEQPKVQLGDVVGVAEALIEAAVRSTPDAS